MKKQFDRFTLTDLVAQGVAGSLYTGEERLPGGVVRPVRIKVLPPLSKADPAAESRFTEEVRILAALASQPHVVTFYGVGLTDGVPWIAMEQASATLDSMLSPSPASPDDVARVIEHVSTGLSALHGLTPPRLHNRLNPANILVCAGNRHFKVTEFGLAAPPTAEPMLSADSVRYAAPELIGTEAGKPGPSTDLYALGHIAYELALGGKLHRQQFPAVMDGSADPRTVSPAKWQAWHHSIPTIAAPAHEVVRGFPRGLGEIIARLMAKPIAQRFGSAADVLAAVAGTVNRGAAAIEGASAYAAPEPVTAAGFSRTSTGQRSPAGSTPSVPPSPTVAPATPAAPAAGFAASAPGGANQRYFVRLRNQTSGPYDLATLQRLARQGQMSRLHQVSTDQRTWKSATTVDGLFT